AAANDHGDIINRQLKAVQRFLYRSVTIQIDVVIGMPISSQEFLDAKSRRGVGGTKKHGVSNSFRNQCHAAKNEGAHEDFAQFAVGLNDRQYALAIQFQDVTGPVGKEPAHAGSTKQDPRFSGELSGAKSNSRFVINPDFERPCFDNKEWQVSRPHLDQNFAFFYLADASVRLETCNLRGS